MSATAPPETGAPPIVRIRDLHFQRAGRPIFSGIDLDIPRGRITGIMGPSGTGKTTLLKLISGQLTPDTGRIEVDGEELRQLSRGELFHLRQRMGMLFQSGALLTDLSVFDNVAFPLREHTSLSAAAIHDQVLLKLEAVGLRGARDLMPSELSGGMARRVALARAIVRNPMLLLYDEPFTGQDPISMGVLAKLIQDINQPGTVSSILVSHDIHETLAIAHWVYIIADGRLMAQGTPQQLREDPSPWTRQFIQGLPDGPVHFHYPAIPLDADLRLPVRPGALPSHPQDTHR